MPAARRSPARVTVASGWSDSFRRRVWPLRAGFVMAAERAAGRRVRVPDIRRVTTTGIVGTISRRRPGSIMSILRTESGRIPREVRLSGLVWRHPSRATKSTVKTRRMKPTKIANNTWLDRQASNRATVTPSRSMPSPECRSLAAHITGARVAGRLTAGQSRAARHLPLRAGRSQVPCCKAGWQRAHPKQCSGSRPPMAQVVEALRDRTDAALTDVTHIWAAPPFPDSGIGAISCCERPVQVLVVGFLRSPVAECRVKTLPIVADRDVQYPPRAFFRVG